MFLSNSDINLSKTALFHGYKMLLPLGLIAKIWFQLLQLVILSVDPIALQKETVRITPDQSTKLKAIFFRERADELPYSEKKLLAYFIEIVPLISLIQFYNAYRQKLTSKKEVQHHKLMTCSASQAYDMHMHVLQSNAA